MATITAGHRHWQLCEDGSTRKHKVRPQAYSCYEISIVYIFTNVYTYIYIHEICLNSKAFRVHDNIYNIDNLTKTHFWHIVDITYNLFTYHRSCSGAKKTPRNCHSATRIPIIFTSKIFFSSWLLNGTFTFPQIVVPESVLKMCWTPRSENSPTPRCLFWTKKSQRNKEMEVELALASFWWPGNILPNSSCSHTTHLHIPSLQGATNTWKLVKLVKLVVS